MREQALQGSRRAHRAASDYVDSPQWRRTPLHTSLSPPRSAAALRCRRKFLHLFPHGFVDANYEERERRSHVRAHAEWEWLLDRETFHDLLRAGQFAEIAARATRIIGRSGLLVSREKNVLHAAMRASSDARPFAEGLFAFLQGRGSVLHKFSRWCEVLAALPRRSASALPWPVATAFGFLAQPALHLLLKPRIVRAAARAYDFPFAYRPQPNGETYSALLDFAAVIRDDLRDLGPAAPRDMIDIYAFLRVQTSPEK